MRYEEGWQLALLGHRTAAIYLWGYAAEMTLKAAWFSLIRFPRHTSIKGSHLGAAVATATNYGITWPSIGRFHNVFAWGQLLIQHRIRTGLSYANSRFAKEVVEHSQRIYDRWRESMRYKRNVAYPYEVDVVADSTHWLLKNRDSL
jgi:hypothetical protein